MLYLPLRIPLSDNAPSKLPDYLSLTLPASIITKAHQCSDQPSCFFPFPSLPCNNNALKTMQYKTLQQSQNTATVTPRVPSSALYDDIPKDSIDSKDETP
jgi:hypothetical protein